MNNFIFIGLYEEIFTKLTVYEKLTKKVFIFCEKYLIIDTLSLIKINVKLCKKVMVSPTTLN